MTMKVDLDDKVALVTGAANGIGKAIADSYVANGARGIYADIAFDSVTAAAAASGSRPLFMDVGDEQRVETGISEIIKDYEKVPL